MRLAWPGAAPLRVSTSGCLSKEVRLDARARSAERMAICRSHGSGALAAPARSIPFAQLAARRFVATRRSPLWCLTSGGGSEVGVWASSPSAEGLGAQPRGHGAEVAGRSAAWLAAHGSVARARRARDPASRLPLRNVVLSHAGEGRGRVASISAGVASSAFPA